MKFDVVPDHLRKAISTPGIEWTSQMIEEARKWIDRDENRDHMLSYTRSSEDIVDVGALDRFIETYHWSKLIKDKYPPPYHDDPDAFSKWVDHEFVAQWLAPQRASLLALARNEGKVDQTEDALQTFLMDRLLELMGRWEPGHSSGKSFRNYLIFCFIRDCRRDARKDAIWRRYQSLRARDDMEDCPDLEIEDPSLTPEEQAKWAEYCTILNRCRRKLDAEEVMIVDLKYFDGLPYSEIAEVLDMDGTSDVVCGKLRTRCHRALEKLKKLISAEAPEWAREGIL
jgi:RNA polymerase sigma factor (sigma-70 family)